MYRIYPFPLSLFLKKFVIKIINFLIFFILKQTILWWIIIELFKQLNKNVKFDLTNIFYVT